MYNSDIYLKQKKENRKNCKYIANTKYKEHTILLYFFYENHNWPNMNSTYHHNIQIMRIFGFIVSTAKTNYANATIKNELGSCHIRIIHLYYLYK